MQAFLDVYADSARAPDVHCLFGRLLHEQGDSEGAAPHLAIAQKAHPGRCDLP
jgi:TolA-binding protein